MEGKATTDEVVTSKPLFGGRPLAVALPSVRSNGGHGRLAALLGRGGGERRGLPGHLRAREQSDSNKDAPPVEVPRNHFVMLLGTDLSSWSRHGDDET